MGREHFITNMKKNNLRIWIASFILMLLFTTCIYLFLTSRNKFDTLINLNKEYDKLCYQVELINNLNDKIEINNNIISEISSLSHEIDNKKTNINNLNNDILKYNNMITELYD